MIRKRGNISPHAMPRTLKHLGGERYPSIENLRTRGGSRCTQDSKWRLGAVGYTRVKSCWKAILAGQSCQDERICMNAKVCSRSSLHSMEENEGGRWYEVKAKAELLSNFTTTTADVKLSDCRFALFAKPDESWQ